PRSRRHPRTTFENWTAGRKRPERRRPVLPLRLPQPDRARRRPPRRRPTPWPSLSDNAVPPPYPPETRSRQRRPVCRRPGYLRDAVQDSEVPAIKPLDWEPATQAVTASRA